MDVSSHFRFEKFLSSIDDSRQLLFEGINGDDKIMCECLTHSEKEELEEVKENFVFDEKPEHW